MRHLSTLITLSILVYLSAAFHTQYHLIKRQVGRHGARTLQRQNSVPESASEKQSIKSRLEKANPRQQQPFTAPPQRARLLRQSSGPISAKEVAKADRQTKASPTDNTAAQAMQVFMNHQTKRKIVEPANILVKSAAASHYLEKSNAHLQEAGVHEANRQLGPARAAIEASKPFTDRAQSLMSQARNHEANYREAASITKKMQVAGLRDSLTLPISATVQV